MAFEPEKIECASCHAAIRANASFCHKCGESVVHKAEEPAIVVGGEKAGVSSAWFKEDISTPTAPIPDIPEEPEFQETIADIPEPEPVAEAAEAALPEVDEAAELPGTPEILKAADAEADQPAESNTVSDPETFAAKVRAKAKREEAVAPAAETKAPLRKKPLTPREKIEMVWDEPAGGINVWFIVGTVAIFLIVLLIVIGGVLLK